IIVSPISDLNAYDKKDLMLYHHPRDLKKLNYYFLAFLLNAAAYQDAYLKSQAIFLIECYNALSATDLSEAAINKIQENIRSIILCIKNYDTSTRDPILKNNFMKTVRDKTRQLVSENALQHDTVYLLAANAVMNNDLGSLKMYCEFSDEKMLSKNEYIGLLKISIREKQWDIVSFLLYLERFGSIDPAILKETLQAVIDAEKWEIVKDLLGISKDAHPLKWMTQTLQDYHDVIALLKEVKEEARRSALVHDYRNTLILPSHHAHFVSLFHDTKEASQFVGACDDDQALQGQVLDILVSVIPKLVNVPNTLPQFIQRCSAAQLKIFLDAPEITAEKVWIIFSTSSLLCELCRIPDAIKTLASHPKSSMILQRASPSLNFLENILRSSEDLSFVGNKIALLSDVLAIPYYQTRMGLEKIESVLLKVQHRQEEMKILTECLQQHVNTYRPADYQRLLVRDTKSVSPPQLYNVIQQFFLDKFCAPFTGKGWWTHAVLSDANEEIARLYYFGGTHKNTMPSFIVHFPSVLSDAAAQQYHLPYFPHLKNMVSLSLMKTCNDIDLTQVVRLFIIVLDGGTYFPCGIGSHKTLHMIGNTTTFPENGLRNYLLYSRVEYMPSNHPNDSALETILFHASVLSPSGVFAGNHLRNLPDLPKNTVLRYESDFPTYPDENSFFPRTDVRPR
ncbi:MAG TPA: hypothetical protein VJL60_03475, partial [Gammaproteobacteria bacterium]|nr:hypothetical protein [Gammaproteobacteria bacterium]